MTCEARHKAQTIVNGIHSAISFEYENEAARLAAGPFDTFDKNKIALQLDGYSLWVLVDTVSETWVQIPQGNLSEYLLLSGASPMEGNLNMDGYNIVNVDLINGVDLTAHASRHENGGGDEIEISNLGTSETNTNYVLRPDGSGGVLWTGIPGGGGGGSVSGPSVTTDNAIVRWDGTDGYYLQNSGIVIDDSDNITGVTSINGVTIENHASRHESGGSDEIDGYQLAVAYTPTNYAAPASDILGLHIEAIDEALATAGDVPSTRNFIAGAGLTGGGDLSADRTFDVVANADGSIAVNANDIQVGVLASDAQHGNLGGGSLHDLANASTAGFFSSDGYNKLTGIEAGAQANTVDSVFGRTGDVVALASDYDASQIDNDSGVPGTYVSDALDYLDGYVGTVAAHATTHESGGSDVIDGYQLSVVYTPENYSVPSSNILGQHLFKIDQELGTISSSIVTDHGGLSGLLDDDHAQYLLVDGTRAMSDDLDVGNNDIVNANDGYFSGSVIVAGLIDPTGLVLDLQSTVPGGTPTAGKSTIWVRDTDGYAIITDENGIDTILSSGGGGGGSGDVVGPASATDNALVRYDGTTGNLIQDSDAILDDSGNLTLVGYVDVTDGYFSNSLTADTAVFGDSGGVEILSTLNGNLTVYTDGYFAQDLEVVGKLTVGDLIDPTGIVFDLQSTVPGGTPAAGKSTLWIRDTDGYAVLTDENGNDVVIGTGAGGGEGSGDVVGPASATDSALVRYDGATGKLIQDSDAILDDSGNLTLVGYVDATDGYFSNSLTADTAVLGDSAGIEILSTLNGNLTVYTDGYFAQDLEVVGKLTVGGTITFSDWPTIISDGNDTIPFDGYQTSTLDLNDQSSVEITLNEPNGPGNFMLILKQGSSTATTTFTWVAENGYDIYAPSGAITVATGTSSRTMIGLAFDGTDWYVESTQPMQVVT